MGYLEIMSSYTLVALVCACSRFSAFEHGPKVLCKLCYSFEKSPLLQTHFYGPTTLELTIILWLNTTLLFFFLLDSTQGFAGTGEIPVCTIFKFELLNFILVLLIKSLSPSSFSNTYLEPSLDK